MRGRPYFSQREDEEILNRLFFAASGYDDQSECCRVKIVSSKSGSQVSGWYEKLNRHDKIRFPYSSGQSCPVIGTNPKKLPPDDRKGKNSYFYSHRKIAASYLRRNYEKSYPIDRRFCCLRRPRKRAQRY